MVLINGARCTGAGIRTSADHSDMVDLATNLSAASSCGFVVAGRNAMALPLPSSRPSSQPSGNGVLSRSVWNWRVSNSVRSKESGLTLSPLLTGTAMASSGSLAIGPKTMSPTAGLPVSMTAGAALRLLDLGRCGSAVPSGTRVLNNIW